MIVTILSPKRWTGGSQEFWRRCILPRPLGQEQSAGGERAARSDLCDGEHSDRRASWAPCKTGTAFEEPRLQEAVDSGRRLILMTAHRRENWGEPIRRIYQAVLEIVQRHPDVAVVFPVHKNPIVREPASRSWEATNASIWSSRWDIST